MALKLVEGSFPLCSSFGISGNLLRPLNQVCGCRCGVCKGQFAFARSSATAEMDALLVPNMSMHRGLKRKYCLFMYLGIYLGRRTWSCPKSLTFWEVMGGRNDRVPEAGAQGQVQWTKCSQRAGGLRGRGVGFGMRQGPLRMAPALLLHCKLLHTPVFEGGGRAKVGAMEEHKRPSSREIPLPFNRAGRSPQPVLDLFFTWFFACFTLVFLVLVWFEAALGREYPVRGERRTHAWSGRHEGRDARSPAAPELDPLPCSGFYPGQGSTLAPYFQRSPSRFGRNPRLVSLPFPAAAAGVGWRGLVLGSSLFVCLAVFSSRSQCL